MGDRFTSFYCFTLFQPCNQSQKLVDIQGFFRQSSGLGFDISPAVREHHRPDFFYGGRAGGTGRNQIIKVFAVK